jgi:hypothetical protein
MVNLRTEMEFAKTNPLPESRAGTVRTWRKSQNRIESSCSSPHWYFTKRSQITHADQAISQIESAKPCGFRTKSKGYTIASKAQKQTHYRDANQRAASRPNGSKPGVHNPKLPNEAK